MTVIRFLAIGYFIIFVCVKTNNYICSGLRLLDKFKGRGSDGIIKKIQLLFYQPISHFLFRF